MSNINERNKPKRGDELLMFSNALLTHLIISFSLLGGVQLFAMIKMLGLLKQDMSSNQNLWAWHGYQVSMRVLELTLCTLLAVIATTPLRSDHNNSPGLEASPGKVLDNKVVDNKVVDHKVFHNKVVDNKVSSDCHYTASI